MDMLGPRRAMPRWYIDLRYVMVYQWVDLRPIFEFCTREQGYKGGGGGAMLAPESNEHNSQVNLGGYLVVCEGKVKQEGKPIGTGSGSVGLYGWTDGYVDTDTGDAQVVGVPRGGGGARQDRLGLGWVHEQWGRVELGGGCHGGTRKQQT